MNLAKAVVTAVATLMVATAVHAAPIINTNVRPVEINDGPATERTLQTALETVFVGSGISAELDQSTAGTWGSATGVPSSSAPTLVLEATGGETTQTFGIWFGTDTNNLFTYDLLLGSACGFGSVQCGATGPGTSGAAGLPSSILLQMDYGVMAVNGVVVAEDELINPLQFGFYFSTPDLTAYSIDSITGGVTRFLAYDDGLSNWVFAFEDGTDFDFNDMVVKVESIRPVPVPEPGSLALLGLGLAGLAAASRRKQKQA